VTMDAHVSRGGQNLNASSCMTSTRISGATTTSRRRRQSQRIQCRELCKKQYSRSIPKSRYRIDTIWRKRRIQRENPNGYPYRLVTVHKPLPMACQTVLIRYRHSLKTVPIRYRNRFNTRVQGLARQNQNQEKIRVRPPIPPKGGPGRRSLKDLREHLKQIRSRDASRRRIANGTWSVASSRLSAAGMCPT